MSCFPCSAKQSRTRQRASAADGKPQGWGYLRGLLLSVDTERKVVKRVRGEGVASLWIKSSQLRFEWVCLVLVGYCLKESWDDKAADTDAA